MIDELVDRELIRIATALASRSPEPGPIEAVKSRTSWRLARAYMVAFGTVLVVGAAVLIALSLWGPDDSPPAANDGSRWDWILDGTLATDDPELRVADPGATPQPQFDYNALGVEQTLIPSSDPILHEGIRHFAVEVDLAVFPFIYIGDVEGTAIQGHMFRSTGAGHDFEGFPIPAICLAVGFQGGGMSSCREADAADADGRDGIISGIQGRVPAGTPQGRIVVDLRVPRATAVVVLTLDDGRSYVQRPVVGVAIFVVADLGTAGISSAAALDASGATLVFQNFARTWAELPDP